MGHRKKAGSFLLTRGQKQKQTSSSKAVEREVVCQHDVAVESAGEDRAEETPRENRAEHREQGRRDISWTGTRKQEVLEAEGGP